ncbi:Fic family protein [Sphingomonas koreensis]|uniref:Fic family protein n=1 Tax=Sphingomonas koreensis TaxID=93064 RepID=UPI00234E9491|nr:Fic family protein [Sphingomonas koreensis]MDC7811543.1 Fic family protein [Sphingomonas koreensis]
MFVFELVGNEKNPVYEKLAIENLDRQYSFLQSIVEVSLALGQPMLSIEVIKALNYHAISCLHVSPGEFRPCQVTVGTYTPPAHFQVPALMQMFTNLVNRNWETADAVELATFVLWRLNHIHPFVNGNGRTARVASYFVLCLKAGGWLPGTKLLPERIVERRPDYVKALRDVDASLAGGPPDLGPLHKLLSELLDEQLKEAASGPATPPPA